MVPWVGLWSVIVAFPYGAMGRPVVCNCGISLWCHGLVCGLRLWHFLMVTWVGLWSVIVAFPYGAMGWSVVCDCGISLYCHG